VEALYNLLHEIVHPYALENGRLVAFFVKHLIELELLCVSLMGVAIYLNLGVVYDLEGFAFVDSSLCFCLEQWPYPDSDFDVARLHLYLSDYLAN